jgi:hypothetical protein
LRLTTIRTFLDCALHGSAFGLSFSWPLLFALDTAAGPEFPKFLSTLMERKEWAGLQERLCGIAEVEY